MQFGDCADEVETEAITCGVATGFETGKALDDSRQVGRRYPRTVIDDLQADAVTGADQRQPDDRADRRMSLSVFNQVDPSLGDELPIAQYRELRLDRL